MPGAYIVLLNEGTPNVRGRAGEFSRAFDARENHVWENGVRGFSVRGLSDAAATAIRNHPDVRLVEPVRLFFPDAVQQLPPGGSNGDQWGLDRIDHVGPPVFDGEYTYDFTGAGVHIYIVDSGVRGGHVEFTGRIGNGSCHVSWWILHPGCSPTIDSRGHGTAVASAAAGTTYGVAKQAIIHPVRIDDDDGSAYCDDIVDGLNWVRNNRQLPAVVNLSYGSEPGAPSCDSVRQAIEALINSGVLVVQSAGNSNVDAYSRLENRAQGSIVVGMTTKLDARHVFLANEGSNWGSTVVIMAPGVNVRLADSDTDDATSTWTGTSFAAPLVTGTAALVLDSAPGLSPWFLRGIILNGANPITIGNGSGVANRLLYSRAARPSAASQALTAAISGQQEVQPYVQYTYTAVVGGTNPQSPYTYVWIVDGDTVATGPSVDLTFPPASATGIVLWIFDAADNAAVSDGMFFVYSSTGTCPPEDPECHESLMRRRARGSQMTASGVAVRGAIGRGKQPFNPTGLSVERAKQEHRP